MRQMEQESERFPRVEPDASDPQRKWSETGDERPQLPTVPLKRSSSFLCSSLTRNPLISPGL